MRHALTASLALVAALAGAPACDPKPDDTTTSDSSSGPGDGPCPPLCLGDCPAACIPSPCWTIGDGCTIHDGHDYISENTNEQCGDGWGGSAANARMACVSPDPDPEGGILGTCVQPCSATEPCVRGTCVVTLGYCVDDKGEPTTPIECPP